MMKISSKILVGVTQRVDNVEAYNEIRDALDQKIIQLLNHAGFLPVPVPNTMINVDNAKQSTEQPMLDNWLQVIQPSALVLSGGNDIGKCVERDTTERYLLDWAKAKRLPVLGICRGLQMMVVWAGANLIKVEGHVRTRHFLDVLNKNNVFPDSVNSFHNLGLTSCPDGFQVLARSEDGVIEAIRHNELPWEGWMWHPEREAHFSPHDIRRLKVLFGS